MLEARLKDVPFFSSLTHKELVFVGQQTDELDVPAGKVLAKEGDLGREFFVVESGTAEVTKDGEHIADMGPGDFFGEIALVAEERRTATVTSTSPMLLIVMSRASFRAIDRMLPEVHARVAKAIEDRRARTAS
jgi:CRP-like cAMP-binding protein